MKARRRSHRATAAAVWAERIPVPYQDPDQYVREAGIEATARLVDGCAPLRATLVAEAWQGECPDPRFGERITMTERSLLECAAWCLRAVMLCRRGELHEVESASASLEREVIALAARGMVAPARAAALDIDAFTGAPRMLAWWCACRSLRASQRASTFFGARYALVTSPLTLPNRGITREDVQRYRLEHGEQATYEWLMAPSAEGTGAWLRRETEYELNIAEDIARPSIEAIGRLLAHQRAQRARAWIAPVLEAMDRGAPLVDTATKLREGANIFEGRT